MASAYTQSRPVIDVTGLEELYIAVVGDVDSGKSTMIGCLSSGKLDDGDGSARSLVARHKHEIESGRTSSCTQVSIARNNRVCTLVDLAGHAAYLKTTVIGLSCYMPDIAFICVGNGIRQPAKDHLAVLRTYEIPIVVIFTKEDLYGNEHDSRRNEVHGKILAYMRTIPGPSPKYFRIGKASDFTVAMQSPTHLIPYIVVSNKTGDGHELLEMIIAAAKRTERVMPAVFAVDSQFVVTGVGLVLSGASGMTISKGDKLWIGPLGDKKIEFLEFRVKSLHNNYRFAINSLAAGQRGCIATNIDTRQRHLIKRGMIITKEVVPITRRFRAKVYILYHASTVGRGYEVLACCGPVSGQVTIEDIRSLDDRETIPVMRSKSKALVTFKFKYRPAYLVVGSFMSFIEGNAKAVGKLVELLD